MPKFESYTPSDEEIRNAESQMTDEQLELSAAREASFTQPVNATFEKNHTLTLEINKSDVEYDKLGLLAEDRELSEKDKFHVTVLGFKNGGIIKKALKKLSAEEQQIKLEQIQTLVSNTNWNFVNDDPAYHISREYVDPNHPETPETRESYIKMIYLPHMREFYRQLNDILETEMEIPPAHVTTHTKSTDAKNMNMGIGVNSETELAQMNPREL